MTCGVSVSFHYDFEDAVVSLWDYKVIIINSSSLYKILIYFIVELQKKKSNTYNDEKSIKQTLVSIIKDRLNTYYENFL